jgi:hypothetical protein
MVTKKSVAIKKITTFNIDKEVLAVAAMHAAEVTFKTGKRYSLSNLAEDLLRKHLKMKSPK